MLHSTTQYIIRVIAEGLGRRPRPEAQTRLRKTPVEIQINEGDQMLVLRKINYFNRGLLQSQFMRREKNYKSVFLALGHSQVLRKINSFNRGLLQSHFWRWKKNYKSVFFALGYSWVLLKINSFYGGLLQSHFWSREKKLQIRSFRFGPLTGALEN